MHPLADVVVDETMSQLALSDIQPDDFDTYTCRVNNSVAQTQKSISLTEAGMCKHGRHMHSHLCTTGFSVSRVSFVHSLFQCVSGICSLLNVIIYRLITKLINEIYNHLFISFIHPFIHYNI